MLSKILHNLCYKVAMSFLKIATSGMCSAITLTSLVKQWWWKFYNSCNTPRASISMLLYQMLYHTSMLVRMLTCECFFAIAVFSGVSFSWEPHSNLTCRRPALNPTPDASGSRYDGSFLLKSFMNASTLATDLACS